MTSGCISPYDGDGRIMFGEIREQMTNVLQQFSVWRIMSATIKYQYSIRIVVYCVYPVTIVINMTHRSFKCAKDMTGGYMRGFVFYP